MIGLKFLSRNRIIGFLVGRYDIEAEAKRLMQKEEQYVSGTDIIKYNESMYILAVIFTFIVLVISFYNLFFLLLLIMVPFILLFSNELEIYLLTNERVIIIKRNILEKTLGIQDETNIALDQIVVLSYSRAPFNRNALYASAIGVIIWVLAIPIDALLELQGVTMLVTVIILALPVFYLIWLGLRLNRRSIELYLIGIRDSFGIGRTKGVPMWFVFDLQLLVFQSLHSSLQTVLQKDQVKESEKGLYYTSIHELLDSTPYELHKKILILLNDKNMTKKQLENLLTIYPKSEVRRGFEQLRKKRYIYFDRKTDTWHVNKSLKVGLKKS